MAVLNLMQRVRNVIIVSLYCMLVLLVAYQVIARFVLNIPAAWAEELARSIFIYCVFLSGSLAIERKANVAFDLILDSLKGKPWKIMYSVSFVLSMVFIIMMLFFGILLMQKNSIVVSPLLKIPTWSINMAIPIGAVLMVLSQIIVYFKTLKERHSEALES